jgi:peptidoglycan hydrolase-like protein with peptidoglycan-binding domain
MFGKNTLAALNQFQSRIGSPVQEVVDEETSAALEGSRPGTGGPAEISQLEGLKLNDGITYGTWERRPRVSNLQIRLTAFGFACKADGMFGPKTNEALHGFQTANGIPPSDAVDRPTADALEGGPGGGTECPSGYIPMPLELQHQRNGMTSA